MNKNPAQTNAGNSLKKEFLIFISIPITIILLVMAVVLLPSRFANPKYDFIYSYCPSYACNTDYSVDGTGHLGTSTNNNNALYGSYYNNNAQLYYYTATTNSSQHITSGDASAYNLSSSNVSPDGYTLTQSNSSGDGFLFWGGSGDYGWYLKNGLKKKKVNLVNNDNYTEGINFIGWVIK